MLRTAVEKEVERFRQFVIASRTSAEVEPEALKCLDRLNALYRQDQKQFSDEDVRWLNVLRGYLGVRLAAFTPSGPHTRRGKRKGDQLDHCWRCETPIDERFTEICAACSEKAYQWRVCPVCKACGCQRSGKQLV